MKLLLKVVLAAALSIALIGCGNNKVAGGAVNPDLAADTPGVQTGPANPVATPVPGSSPGVVTFSKTMTNQVDVLWVVDNSSQMQVLTDKLVSASGTALSYLQGKNWNFHMGVTVSDAYLADSGLINYNGANANMAALRDGAASHSGVSVINNGTQNIASVFSTNLNEGQSGNGDERAFSSMRVALQSPMNASLRRPNAFLSVVVVSDEDDFSGNGRGADVTPDHSYTASTLDPLTNYVQFLDQLTNTTGAFRNYSVSSITVLDNACLSARQQQSTYAIIGQRYMQLSQATNGVLGSICDSSYDSSLSAIMGRVGSQSTRFFMSQAPSQGAGSLSVTMNGASVAQDPSNGWTFDAATTAVVFHGSGVPGQGDKVVVSFPQ